jgi:hypothetical protein
MNVNEGSSFASNLRISSIGNHNLSIESDGLGGS